MYFSLAITEEKEEETLPLLRMTGVRNFTLLIGKSVPRLAIVILLILVSAPFLLLSVTLGGVVPEQIIALVLGMMCYAFCLSQIGLFSSTISRSSRRATSVTIMLWIALEFGSWFLSLFAAGCREWGLHSHFSNCSTNASEFLWQRSMWSASTEFLMYERGESLWHVQMTFHLCVGLGFFGLSWLVFEPMNQASLAQGASASENMTRGSCHTDAGLTFAALLGHCRSSGSRGSFWWAAGCGFLILTIGMPMLSIGLVLGISTSGG